MNQLNSLIREIKGIIENSFTNGRTILVWYDRDGTLSDIIHEAVPQDISIIKFDGSYLKIRATIDGDDPNLERKWFVYIPESPQEPSWIRDYETIIGSKVEYTIEKLLTDHFGLEADQETKQLLSGYGSKLIATHWSEVMERVRPPVSKEELAKALLAAAFELGANFTVSRAIIEYVSDPEQYIQKLDRLQLHKVLAQIIREELGLTNLPIEAPVPPDRLAAAILLSELVVRSGGQGAKEFKHLLPAEGKRRQWVRIADEWMSNIQHRKSFVSWSDKLSKQYDVKGKLFGFDIVKVQSFRVVDDVLLDEVFNRITAGGKDALTHESRTILSIAEARTKAVWADTTPAKSWNIIKTALLLLSKCHEARKDLSKIESGDIEQYLAQYTAEDGWWRLDELHRKLSSHKNQLTDERINTIFVKQATRAYTEWLHNLAMQFSEGVSHLSGWPPVKMSSQLDFWDRVRRIQDKVVVFLVDALRYDLSKELAEKLETSGSKVSIEPMVASIPSVTEVGMASLMPNKGKTLRLDVENGKLRVRLDGGIISTKEGRTRWLQSHFGSQALVMDLKDILRQEIDELRRLAQQVRYIVITHQEVDRAGEFEAEVSLTFFEDIIQRLANLILRLHEAGIRNVVVSTDHGFLIVPEEWKPMLIEGISSKDLSVSRRYVVGRVPKHEGLITFPVSAIGFVGDIDVAIPKGLAMLSIQGEIPRFVHGGLTPQEVFVPYLVSTFEKAEKVHVTIGMPEPITSMKFYIDVTPVEPSSSERARKIQIRIFSEGEEVERSDVVKVHTEARRCWLKLKKNVPKVEVHTLDVETEEILFVKSVGVQLAGYDDLFEQE